MDCDITQEEGEILDIDENSDDRKIDQEDDAYKTIQRPETQKQPQLPQLQYSDSSGDDSDDESSIKLKKPTPASSKFKSKSGTLWSQMLQEECLTDTMKTCEVNRKRKYEVDRGVETYECPIEEQPTDNKKPRTEDKSSDNQIVRKFARGKVKSLHRSKELPDLVAPEDCSEDDLAKEVWTNLEEENTELISRIVRILGKEEFRNFYKNTQRVEKKGGMLIMNKQRRRTSGGVFLFLVKTSTNISEIQKSEIFNSGNKTE